MGSDRIERLGPYDVLGETVTIDTFEPLAGALRAALTDLPRAGRHLRGTRRLTAERFTDDSWSVSWPDRQRYDGPSADMAFYDVLCALNDLGAARVAADGGVGLHGGAVVVDGRAIALVGHSGAGKSTLTARLVLDGHPFVADEIAAVDPDLRIRPFHRPIGLRLDSLELLGITADDGPYGSTYPIVASRHTTLSGPVELAAIAFVDRASAGITPQIIPITPAEALQSLCNQTLGTHDLEREAFRRLDRIARAVPAVAINFGTVDEGAELVARVAREVAWS